jgi:hypothetical protein
MRYYREEKTQAMEKIPLRKAIAVSAAVLALLAAPRTLHALEYQGRIDTRYQLKVGDNAFDNDLFQYHQLDLGIAKNLTFQWNGGIRKDLDGQINTLIVVIRSNIFHHLSAQETRGWLAWSRSRK